MAINDTRTIYCDRCDRRVEAMPAAPGEWRCPDCLGPVHAGSRRRATVFNRVRDFAIHALGLLAAAGLLADQVGVAAWLLPLAILPLLWVRSARADDDQHRPYSYPAPVAPDQWLDDARASYGRGTHISTLAVRYGVEPEWLEEKLGRGPT